MGKFTLTLSFRMSPFIPHSSCEIFGSHDQQIPLPLFSISAPMDKVIIDSDNGLVPMGHQAIIYNNADSIFIACSWFNISSL